MDEIIYLEPDEEITSVIDKIKNTKNKNIGLVVPRDATLLQSVVNLRLLIREASVFGKEIAIVTMDKIGRNLAAQVGIPVYSSVKEEKPAFVPAPPVHSSHEVIEIDMAPKKPEVSSEEQNLPNGFNVHHFQEGKPIIQWRAGEKPVMKNNVSPNRNGQDMEKPRLQIDRHAKKIIWPIVVILLILAGIAGFLLIPTADVQVLVKADNLQKTVPVALVSSLSAPDINQGAFPGNLLQSSTEKTQKFSATGQKNLGGKASGTVVFTNGLDSLTHKFAAGTKLIANSKTFILKSAVSVPGATVQNLKVVPGSATATIEAENAGEDYNIKAGKFTIVGVATNQQSALYAQSSADLKGGFTKVAQVVSKDDYENAKKQMIDELSAQVDQDLKTKAANLKILEKAVVMPDPEVSSSSNIDQEAKDFEMKVKLTKQVMAFDMKKFQNFMIETLGKQVSEDKMIAIPTEEDLGLTIDKQAYDKGELDLIANVSAKISPKISADSIKSSIIGKSQAAAEKQILSLPGVEKVDIVFKPAILKRVSDLARNIKVKINYSTD